MQNKYFNCDHDFCFSRFKHNHLRYLPTGYIYPKNVKKQKIFCICKKPLQAFMAVVTKCQ